VIDLRLFAASRNPTGLSHTDAPPTDRDSDIVRSVLSVGTFEDWCGAGLSDHVPIVVDVKPH